MSQRNLPRDIRTKRSDRGAKEGTDAEPEPKIATNQTNLKKHLRSLNWDTPPAFLPDPKKNMRGGGGFTIERLALQSFHSCVGMCYCFFAPSFFCAVSSLFWGCEFCCTTNSYLASLRPRWSRCRACRNFETHRVESRCQSPDRRSCGGIDSP